MVATIARRPLQGPAFATFAAAVNELARRVIESLRAGGPKAEDIAHAGSPEPAADAAALASAARDADLADQLEHWIPGLLRSARPGAGARHLAAIAKACRDAGRPLAALADRPGLAALVGNSSFLARWLVRETTWLDDLNGELAPEPARVDADADWRSLRRAKYRGLLRVAARDLAGRRFDAGLAELSDLADDVLRRALVLAARRPTESADAQRAAGERSRAPAEAGAREAPALFALGKLGGRELNFSSDVDLLFVCDAPPDERGNAARESAAHVVRELKRRLEERTEEGFGYRVDLDLRPEGSAGALVRGVEGALGYYELRGAEWERQMLLRLRFVDGSQRAARDFTRGIEPFVYRRTFDPSVIESARQMKARIEREHRESGRDLEEDLKQGPGGIRDVEFTVQALQLFHAGRRPELRTGHVLDAIAALARAGLLPDASADALGAGYRWLRRAEHALQLVEEQQTAQLPSDAAERAGLARRMGYAEVEGDAARRHFEADRARVLAQVREQFDALVLGAGA
jgi:[glutamine synthetase] adenylyltransferase / [glutamine synthetase]-adenylyl-L-tyrosine phosphorylase